MQQSEYSGLMVFLAGLCVGAGLGLLLAPRTGEDFRDMLKDQMGKTTDELIERGKEALQSAIQQGREYLETGAPDRRRSVRSTAKA